jgi:hypothetical protein
MADIAWIVVVVTAALLEIFRPQSALSSLSALVARHSLGRVLLVGVWGWLGWHLFTRYGIQVH